DTRPVHVLQSTRAKLAGRQGNASPSGFGRSRPTEEAEEEVYPLYAPTFRFLPRYSGLYLPRLVSPFQVAGYICTHYQFFHLVEPCLQQKYYLWRRLYPWCAGICCVSID